MQKLMKLQIVSIIIAIIRYKIQSIIIIDKIEILLFLS